jgi:hypothetical protein
METYKIENPTTKQLFDAILKNEYLTMDQLNQKAKQLYILLKDHFCSNDVFITFANVTNSGGFPIFFSENCCMYEVASDFNSDWYELNEKDQNEIIELYGCYTQDFQNFSNK